jgi:hypothetical protein
VSVAWASDRIDAVKRERGRTLRSSTGAALKLFKALMRGADRAGCVLTRNDRLARQIHVKSRKTVCAAAHVLVDACLIDLPVRVYDQRGYVCGLRYQVRADAAYGAKWSQRDLPFKSRNTKSSASHAPPRPLTPATMGFVQVAAWEVTNGPDVPDNLPDVSQAIRDWLASKGATASERDIRTAMDHVDRERRGRQRPLPLMGVVARGQARQVAPRTTTAGAADRSLMSTWDQHWAAVYAAEAAAARGDG